MTTKSYWLFLMLLVVPPLAFGTVEPWSRALMETAAALALLFFVFGDVPSGRERLRRVPGIIPLSCLLAYMAFQVVPLPAGVVGLLSPAAYNLRAGTTGLFGPVQWIPLSLAPRETVSETLRLAASAVMYVLTVQLLSRGDRLRRTVHFVLIFSTLLAVFGILQYLLYNQRIFWLRELTAGGTPFGPFVNRNHYAGFMEMVFPVALSVFLASRPSAAAGSLRERTMDFLNHPRGNVHILSGLACIIIATSVFLSLSRGGIISLSLSLMIFGVLLPGRKAARSRGVIIVSVCILIVLSVGWFGWQPIFDRFDKIRDARGDIADARKVIWSDSVGFIHDFPATGAGFGSFLSLYPRYRSLEGGAVVDHAHNDYIELMTDGGAVAVVLAAWFLAAVLLPSFRVFRRRHDAFAVHLFIGSAAGLSAILIHSVTDFNLHIGSNCLYFFFLSGLAVSAAHARFRGEEGGTLLPERPASALRWARPAAALLVVATVAFSAGTLLAGYYYSSISKIRLPLVTDRGGLGKIGEVARRAVFLDPLEPRYRAAVGDIELALGSAAAAAAAYQRAVSLGPADAQNLQRLGRIYAFMKDPARARLLMLAGIAAGPRSPAARREYGLWLMAGGERDEGLRVLREAISLETDKTRDYIAALVLQGMGDGEIAAALPQRVEPHLIFADYLSKTGKDDGAVREYREALRYLPYEREVRAGFYRAPYDYFMGRGAYDEAMAVMREGVAALPKDAGLRLAAAAAYEKAGMMNRAAEEYRAVLIIDSDNAAARQKLEEKGGK